MAAVTNTINPNYNPSALLGETLLTKARQPAKDTLDLLEKKEVIGLYFSASWCPPCKAFSPMLIDFYNSTSKAASFEIIYISSDKTVDDFEAYYSKMPWLAVPFIQGSAAIKSRLSQVMGIKGIPTLIIIDAKSGMLLTASGREDVMKVMSDAGHGKNAKVKAAKEMVEGWKKMPKKMLSEAANDGDRPFIIKIIMFFARNPMYIFGLLYIYRQLNKKMIEWYGDSDAPTPDMDEDGAGAGDRSEF